MEILFIWNGIKIVLISKDVMKQLCVGKKLSFIPTKEFKLI